MIVEMVLCATVMTAPPPRIGQDSSADQGPVKTATLTKSLDASEPKEPEWRQIEMNIIKLTNEQRVRNGRKPLEIDPDLMESARRHAAWMARNRSMVHTRQAVAENIAMGQRDSQAALRAWMNSSGHRANILNGGNRRIGAAAYRTAGGTIYWCQQFRR